MICSLGIIAPGNFGSKEVSVGLSQADSCAIELFGSRLVDGTRNLLYHSRQRGDLAACGQAFRDSTKRLLFRNRLPESCSSLGFIYRHLSVSGRPLKVHTKRKSSGCAGHGLVPSKLTLTLDWPPLRPQACFILSRASVDVYNLPIFNTEIDLFGYNNDFNVSFQVDRYKAYEFEDLPDYFCDNPWEWFYKPVSINFDARFVIFDEKLFLVSFLSVDDFTSLKAVGILEPFQLGSFNCLLMKDQEIHFSDDYGPVVKGRISSVGSKKGIGEACCEHFCSYNPDKESSYEVDLVISGFDIVDDDCCRVYFDDFCCSYVALQHEGINGLHKLILTEGCFWSSSFFIRNYKNLSYLFFNNLFCDFRPRVFQAYVYSEVSQDYFENEKLLRITLTIYLYGPLVGWVFSKQLSLENRGPLRKGESFNFRFEKDDDPSRSDCGLTSFDATVIFK